MTEAPLVTIAIPTVNRLDYLKESVSSALAQDYPAIEVLIGQDPAVSGANEELQSWCRQIASENPQVRYQCARQHLGLAGNWMALADSASGQYIAIIGDDDRLLPSFASTLVQKILPDKDVIFCNHFVIDKRGVRQATQTAQTTSQYGRNSLPPGLLSQPEQAAWQGSVPMSACLIKTESVRRLKFKQDLNNPDLEFFVRLAQEGAKFFFCPDYLSEYRIHRKSATASGLTNDLLVNYLLELQPAPAAEPFKRQFLARHIPNAVSRHLLAGEVAPARKLIKSPYYPSVLSLTNCIQKTIISWPDPVTCSVYRALRQIKHLFQLFSNKSQSS